MHVETALWRTHQELAMNKSAMVGNPALGTYGVRIARIIDSLQSFLGEIPPIVGFYTGAGDWKGMEADAVCPETGRTPSESFARSLKPFVEEARRSGAIPLLVSCNCCLTEQKQKVAEILEIEVVTLDEWQKRTG